MDKMSGRLITRVVALAIPNAMSMLAMVLVNFITVLFVSKLNDPAALGGVGVGGMIFNILGLSLGIGFSAALDTLVSRSSGAGVYKQCGIYFQQSVVICTMVCIPASLILLSVEPLLLSIGQDPVVASHAGSYVTGTVPCLWLTYLTNAMGTFLRAQQLPQATAYATWLSNFFHIGSCFVFITQLELGAFGAGLAYSATQAFSCLFLFGWIHFVRPGTTKQSWVAWNCKEATSDLKAFLDLALPCAMLMWAEWWCSEIMTLLAGYLGVEALAAHTAVLQLFVLIYMTAGGISCAGAALVGNAVGAGDAQLAKQSAKVSVVVMLFASVIFDSVIFFGSDALADRFSAHEESVREQIKTLLNILLIVVPLDSLQTVIDGILRGLGKQSVAFKIKLCCMWGIRIPGAALLAFNFKMGVTGVWWGSAAGLFATMVIYVLLVLRVNWDAEIDEFHSSFQAMADEHKASPGSMRSPTENLLTPGMCRTPSGLVMSPTHRPSPGPFRDVPDMP